ncbi:MAG: hypothetical protein ACFCUI_00685 [Bernardetiaceae bacterium]
MAKLKNIVKQLSLNDYQFIYSSLEESGAGKSAHLIKSLRERNISDEQIMRELEVNPNAYYTLRSRLNQKIEEYLIQRIESPRTDLLKKVANIMELAFTRKHAIAVATLKKLEKELIDYDLFNELMIVYKILKKLHIHTDEYYTYSQLYNKHVALMLALDKAEDVMGSYFKKFGEYSLGGDTDDYLQLELLYREIRNINAIHQSHRLYVYQSCVSVFHRLYVQEQPSDMEDDPIDVMLKKSQRIFKTYPKDALYFHLELVFGYLNFAYHDRIGNDSKAEECYEEVNDRATVLLSNYSWYTYPTQFLQVKMSRAIDAGQAHTLAAEADVMFEGFVGDENNFAHYLNYQTYRALADHHAGRYNDARQRLNDLLNHTTIKKYPYALLECKALLAVTYVMLREEDLFHQLVGSIQRQIRLLGKRECWHVVVLIKLLKTALSPTKRDRQKKIAVLVKQFEQVPRKLFSPTAHLTFTTDFVENMCVPSEH